MRIIRRTAMFLVLAAGLGGSGCNVDQSGLTSAGGGGTKGGLAGGNGIGTAGSTGAGGTAIPATPGTAGTGDAAGVSGGTGTAGTSGTEHTGLAGSTGTAGVTGAAGVSGAAGKGGAAGAVGPGTGGITGGSTGGGTTGTAGTTGNGGTTGSAGSAGGGGTTGVAGNTGSAGATGGAAGTSTGGRGGTGGHVATCGPSTCPTGCCQDNQCVTMPTDKACGTAGAACQTCGPCFRCSTKRACEADPKANWAISCESAVILPTRPNGSSWDPPGSTFGNGSKPDPYCSLWSSDGGDGSTAVITDTLTPSWPSAGNVTSLTRGVSTTVLLAGGWTISVFDMDGMGPVGAAETICTTTPSVSSSDLRSGGFTVNDVGSCSEIVLGFTCLP